MYLTLAKTNRAITIAYIMQWGYRLSVSFLLVCGILLNTSLGLGTAHAATNSVSPADPNIKYIGRWDTSSSTVHTSYWPGAYFKTNFTGTTVEIQLAASVNIYVSIDGGTDVHYSNVSGIVNLTPTALTYGNHSLRVASPSEQDDIQFQGLILDAGSKTTAPTLSSQLIEFIGDSITAGATDSKQALSDYAWLTGEQLHVEHTQIAQSGICLIDNVQCNAPTAVGMSRQFFKLQTAYFPNSPNWDFSRYQANAVVINLGTNDESLGLSDTTFQTTYITFLQNIRAVYPKTVIFAMRPFNGSKAGPTLAAVQAVNASGDTNVHYIDTTGWLTSADFNGLHPNDAGQAQAASHLASILASPLGKTSPAMAPSNDGHLEIFSRSSDGNIWHVGQTSANSTSWNSSEVIQSGYSFNGDPAVGIWQGKLQVFALGSDNNIWYTSQSSDNGAWDGWTPLQTGVTFQGTPAVGNDANGNLEVFARGSDNNIWHNVFTTSWSGWHALFSGYSFSGDPAVGAWQGALQVFARGADNNIWHTGQSGTNGAWDGWNTLQTGVSFQGTPAVGNDANGNLEVFARGSDNNIWHNVFTTSWSGWHALFSGYSFSGDPAVGAWQGALQVFARGADNNIWHTGQSGTNGAWDGWNTLQTGVSFQGTPAVGNDANGNLEVFARGSDTNLWNNVFTTSWSGWHTL